MHRANVIAPARPACARIRALEPPRPRLYGLMMSTADESLATRIRSFLTLGLPLIGSQLAQYLINLTDTLMMGWYGVDDLAAVVLANSIVFVLILVGAGFGWAVMPLVAAAVENGDHVQARRVTRMGLWASMTQTLCLTQPTRRRELGI